MSSLLSWTCRGLTISLQNVRSLKTNLNPIKVFKKLMQIHQDSTTACFPPQILHTAIPTSHEQIVQQVAAIIPAAEPICLWNIIKCFNYNNLTVNIQTTGSRHFGLWELLMRICLYLVRIKAATISRLADNVSPNRLFSNTNTKHLMVTAFFVFTL